MAFSCTQRERKSVQTAGLKLKPGLRQKELTPPYCQAQFPTCSFVWAQLSLPEHPARLLYNQGEHHSDLGMAGPARCRSMLGTE